MLKHAMILSTLTGALALAGLGCDVVGPAEGDTAAVLALASTPSTSSLNASPFAGGALSLKMPMSWGTNFVAPRTPEGPALGAVAGSDRAIQGDAAAIHEALDAYGECAMDCSEHPDAIATNAETCTLTCQNVAESAGITAGSPAHALLGTLDVCLDECDTGSFAKDTNRETCRLNCAAVYDTKAAELRSSAVDRPPTRAR
ncbi:MAG: hypothetical protein R3B09_31015 [Nannocystaceae bacterium]